MDAFGGHRGPKEHAARYVPLGHCAAFIERRLRENRDLLTGTQFKDAFGFFALLDKLTRSGEEEEEWR